MWRLIRILKWIWAGCHFIYYDYFGCGCCGKLWRIPFFVPSFDSCGEWWDTWGVCPKGKGCNTEG